MSTAGEPPKAPQPSRPDRQSRKKLRPSPTPPKPPRALPGGPARLAELARGSGGRVLCRRCGAEVPRGRRTFCSGGCVHEWRLRTSPAYLRECVLARDRGVCARCTVDTLAAYALLRRSRGRRRMDLFALWGIRSLQRKSLWDADHIQPVAEGGGACDLSNLRTLCLHCHRVVTTELRHRLARGREANPPTLLR